MEISKKIPNELPEEYKHTIVSYMEELQKELKNNLKLILLIGSSSSGTIIENWSDIDVILVLESYKIEYVDKIKEIVKKYDIKIGNTIYSKVEFENKKIDPKTYYYLLLLQENDIKLQYKSEDIRIPKISTKECKAQYMSWLTEHLHSYKRMWLYEEIPEGKIRDIFKNTYLIMKAILIINDNRPQNYKQVFEMYAEKFNYKKLEFEKFIKDYQNNEHDRKEIIKFAKEFSEEISNNLKI